MSQTTSKPHTYVADITHLPPALQHLTRLKRWVVWRWELRTDKNGAQSGPNRHINARIRKTAAKSNDPSTWGTYEAAVAR